MDIGTATATALRNLTVSPTPCEKSAVAKPSSLIPSTVSEALEIQRWIESGTDETDPPITLAQMTRHLQFLSATLPSKNVDDDAGRDRVAVYFRMLGGYSDKAIAYMARRVCAEMDWFPTPHQCLQILASYAAPTSDRQVAKVHCQAFWQSQMDQFIADLMEGPVDQAEIDAKPDQWKRIAECRGALRWIDGKFFQRLHQIAPVREVEPVKPAAPAPREPTREDYRAMGLTDAQIDACNGARGMNMLTTPHLADPKTMEAPDAPSR